MKPNDTRYPKAQDWRQPAPEFRKRNPRLLILALLCFAVAVAFGLGVVLG